MELSYRIRPEMFDRLFGDWSALDKFQRTRGVLRLMAPAISQLWQRGDRSLVIMPGNLPMGSPGFVSEIKKQRRMPTKRSFGSRSHVRR